MTNLAEPLDAPVPLSDRGLAYGHGVFETIAVTRHGPALLERHLHRLLDGAERLGLSLQESRLRAAIEQALGGGKGDSRILRIRVSAGDSARRYIPSTRARDSGLRLKVFQVRQPIHPLLAGIKHLNRLDQVLAAAELVGTAWDDGLMLDAEGYVVEALSSNLFAVMSDGALVTPLVDRCGVAGTLRQLILDEVPSRFGIEVQETRLLPEQFLACKEVFITNAVRGIRPVAGIDQVGEWECAPLAARLARWLREEVLFEFQQILE